MLHTQELTDEPKQQLKTFTPLGGKRMLPTKSDFESYEATKTKTFSMLWEKIEPSPEILNLVRSFNQIDKMIDGLIDEEESLSWNDPAREEICSAMKSLIRRRESLIANILRCKDASPASFLIKARLLEQETDCESDFTLEYSRSLEEMLGILKPTTHEQKRNLLWGFSIEGISQ